MNNKHSNERLIDACLNRLREGIRVLEDVARFVFDDEQIAKPLKNLRHLCKINDFVSSRSVTKDVLKPSTKEEQTRQDLKDIITANFKRSQESARSLEEIFKLTNIEKSSLFKSVRYELYDLEQAFLQKDLS